MRHPVYLVFIFTMCSGALAQENDTIRVLKEVTVKAYAYDRPAQDVPAAVGVVGKVELNRFGNTSLLPAVNTIPGVRMEERSPGSYRFAIRGSSLRSPFGVRNVKFYWNGLPFTDGGGNTYLNLLDFNSIDNMEIIKGPGSSLYGAGTGGVVLLQSPKLNSGQQTFQASTLGGSYGLFRLQAGFRSAVSSRFHFGTEVSFQQAQGYRQQTKMKRQTVQFNWTNLLSSKSFLHGTFLISGLNYETPGGLTLAQYNADPSQARPATPTLPGAVEQKAEVRNNTQYLGLNFDHQWSDNWSTRIGMFYSQSDFDNPTIRNYEKRKEYNWGGRTDTQYRFNISGSKAKVTFGAEYQDFYSTLINYDNLQGTPGNVQTDDQLWSQLATGFGQIDLDLPKNFFITLGASYNYVSYKFFRLSETPPIGQYRNFDGVISPRLALLKKFNPSISVYANISNGFSPPTLAEVRPSTAAINTTLNPEQGTSYEAGVKGRFAKSFDYTLSLYDFELSNAIVIQRDATGADYFINAGSTSQKGAEVYLSWNTAFRSNSNLRFWISYSYNHYRFGQYINDGVDYSGKNLTGVAPNMVTGGIDWRGSRSYIMITMNYMDRIPLNDANSEFASEYFLLGSRLGYRLSKVNSHLPLELFFGVDNMLNQTYSLGNDLNAVGGRYYNAAAPANFYLGLILLKIKNK